MKLRFFADGAYCECGKKLEFTGDGYYTFMEYDSRSGLIFARCNHGNVVVDKREKTAEEKRLDNAVLSLA